MTQDELVEVICKASGRCVIPAEAIAASLVASGVVQVDRETPWQQIAARLVRPCGSGSIDFHKLGSTETYRVILADDSGRNAVKAIRGYVADAVKEAVAQERQRCARIVKESEENSRTNSRLHLAASLDQ